MDKSALIQINENVSCLISLQSFKLYIDDITFIKVLIICHKCYLLYFKCICFIFLSSNATGIAGSDCVFMCNDI